MCDINATFCRLCLNVTNCQQTADLADNQLCTVLENVFPGLQLDLVQTPKICLFCKEKLRFAFVFKNNVLSNEQKIKSSDCFVNTNDMCRLCLKETHGNSVVYMYEKNHCPYSFELIRTVTEIATAQLNFAIFDKPVMCTDCWSKVKDTYRFKKHCFDNEEKLRNLSKNTGAPNSLSSEEVLTNIILKERALTGTSNNKENNRTPDAPSELISLINLDSDDEDIHFQDSKQIQPRSDNNIVVISDSDSDTDQPDSKNKAESSDSESSEEIFDEALIDDVVEIRIKGPQKNEDSKLNTVKIKNDDIAMGVHSSNIRFLDEMKQEIVKQEISFEEHGIYDDGCTKFKQESWSSVLEKTSLLTPSSHHNVKPETSDQQTLFIAPSPALKQVKFLMINLIDCVKYRSNLNITKIATEKEQTSHLRADLKTNSPPKRTIRCGECDFVSSTKDIMTRHMEKHILYSDTGHKCPNCRKVYRNPDILEEHIQSCEGGLRKRVSSEKLSNATGNESDKKKPNRTTDNSRGSKLLEGSKETTLQASTDSTNIKSLIYGCSICSYKSRCRNQYKFHLKSVHDRVFICDVCQKGYKTYQALCGHKQTHRTNGNFQCAICRKSFKTDSYLKAHQRTHSTNRKYICDLCQHCYKTKTNLKRHLQLHYHKWDYVCHICHIGFKTSSLLFTHKKKHFTTRNSRGSKLLDSSKETTVEASTSSTNIKSLMYRCNKCSYKSKCRNQYEFHIKNVHGSEFISDNCQKGYKTYRALYCHRQLQHIDKHFQCDVCLKKFKTIYNLKTHQLTTHSTKRKYICNICHKGFKRRDVLKYHVLRHFEDRKFVCDICQKGFKTPNCLKQHQEVHADVTAFVCHICQHGFKRKCALVQHLKLHFDNFDYVCHICQKGFKTRILLYSHKKKHSVEKKTLSVD